LETLLCSPRSEVRSSGEIADHHGFQHGHVGLEPDQHGLTGLFVLAAGGGGRPCGESESWPAPVAAVGAPSRADTLAALFSALALAVAAFAAARRKDSTTNAAVADHAPSHAGAAVAHGGAGYGHEPDPGHRSDAAAAVVDRRSIRRGLRYAGPCWPSRALLPARHSLAIDQFNNESVLFRDSERWELGLWLRHLVRERADTPSLGQALLCGLLLLLIRFFASFLLDTPDSWSRFATQTTVTLVAFVASPALFMAILLTRSPRKTLLLRKPPLMTLLVAVILAVVIHPAGVTLPEVSRRFIRSTRGCRSSEVHRPADRPGSPGVESVVRVGRRARRLRELAFRGFILSGLRHVGHKWAAILASSIFFGAAMACCSNRSRLVPWGSLSATWPSRRAACCRDCCSTPRTIHSA